MSAGLAWSFVPQSLKERLRNPQVELVEELSPASAELLSAYIQWSGGDERRYQGTLPAHFFSHYGMRMVAKLTSLAPCNMLSVVNQGCRFRIAEDLPTGVPLELRGRFVDCREENGRLRVHTRVHVRGANGRGEMTVDSMAAVIRGGGRRTSSPPDDTPAESWGSWSADRRDGQRFFFLTGDFNPIHTFWPVARRTRFGGCILHGFGSLARSWEILENRGEHVTDLDIRFVNPAHLPSGPNQVLVGAASGIDGQRELRVVAPSGKSLLRGRFSAETRA